MNASTRRAVIAALLGAGAVSGLGRLLPPLQAASGLPLRLPDTPLRLDRLLQRGLGEADVLTVRRSWQITFARQARGIVISGTQIAATVDAPPHLAEIAQVEQQRDASALFPVMLSGSGAILNPLAPVNESEALVAAVRAAEMLITRQPVPPDERARYRYYLAEVQKAGAGLLDTLPADLFFPLGIPVTQTEDLALPEGLNGRLMLRYEARAQADRPWLAHAERRVTTRVAGFERNASEVWTLAPV